MARLSRDAHRTHRVVYCIQGRLAIREGSLKQLCTLVLWRVRIPCACSHQNSMQCIPLPNLCQAQPNEQFVEPLSFHLTALFINMPKFLKTAENGVEF